MNTLEQTGLSHSTVAHRHIPQPLLATYIVLVLQSIFTSRVAQTRIRTKIIKAISPQALPVPAFLKQTYITQEHKEQTT